VIRVIDSLQLTANYKVSTPVNWKRGEDVVISGAVSNGEAQQLSPTAGKKSSPTSESSPNRS